MEHNVNCIYCIYNGKSEDTGGHLYINKEKGVFHCKRCGESGKWDEGRQIPLFTGIQRSKADLSKVNLFSFLLKMNLDTEKVFRYGTSRLPEHIVLTRCMWSPDLPRRLFFPQIEENKVVAWQARSIDETNPKYLSYGKMSQYVYNATADNKEAVICEGPISALSITGGIALYGKNISKIQRLIILHLYNKVYLAVESGAEKEWEKIKRVLSPHIPVISIIYPIGTDPNDYTVEENEAFKLKAGG